MEERTEAGRDEDDLRLEVREEIASRRTETVFHAAASAEDVPVRDADAELERHDHADQKEDIFLFREKIQRLSGLATKSEESEADERGELDDEEDVGRVGYHEVVYPAECPPVSVRRHDEFSEGDVPRDVVTDRGDGPGEGIRADEEMGVDVVGNKERSERGRAIGDVLRPCASCPYLLIQQAGHETERRDDEDVSGRLGLDGDDHREDEERGVLPVEAPFQDERSRIGEEEEHRDEEDVVVDVREIE